MGEKKNDPSLESRPNYEWVIDHR